MDGEGESPAQPLQPPQPEAPPAAAGAPTRLAVLMFTDIAGSTDLKSKLGSKAYVSLAARHDAIFQALVAAAPGADILKDIGDGFMCEFPTASAAVDVALAFQRALGAGEWSGPRLQVRIGVHQGQVAILDGGRDGKAKMVSLAADTTARVQALAMPGQILMTRPVFDDARQFVARGGDEAEIRWMAHGPYRFKGVDDPTDVFEVGQVGLAPLRAPPDGEKARRAVASGEEDMYDWRPAAGQPIPRRPGWVLQRKIGDGGFGEVWLGRQPRTRMERVFKFCFDADRLRSFRRELTIFRLLREVLGDRQDIARLHDVQFDKPPYFIESEYTELGDLSAWAEAQGGVGAVPEAARLEIVATIAEAAAAAHSVGVLHKDIKPSNVLMYRSDDGTARARLADFGIGLVTDEARLRAASITATGMTEAQLAQNESSRTGTRLYAPPETLAGQAFTVQGDVYALGVLLYQVMVGDLHRPMAQEWQAGIADPLLRQDIADAVRGDPARRMDSAGELARRLRGLPARRALAAREAEAAEREARRKRAARATALASAVLLAASAGLAVALVRENSLRRTARDAQAAELAALQGELAAQKAEAVQRGIAEGSLAALVGTLTSATPMERGRDATVAEALDASAPKIDGQKEGAVRLRLREAYGRIDRSLNRYQSSAAHFARAVAEADALRAAAAADPALAGAVAPDVRSGAKGAGLRLLQARVTMELGDYALALRLISEATRAIEAAGAGDPLATVNVVSQLGALHHNVGDYDAAEAYFRQAMALLDAHEPQAIGRWETRDALGRLLIDRGLVAAGVELAAQANRGRAGFVPAAGTGSISLAFGLLTEAYGLWARGDFAGAEATLLASHAMYARLHRDPMAPMAMAAAMEVTSLREDAPAGALKPAAAGEQEGLPAVLPERAALGGQLRLGVIHLRNRARFKARAGDWPGAEALFRRAVALDESLAKDAREPSLLMCRAHTLLVWAEALLEAGRAAEAEALAERAYADQDSVLGGEAPHLQAPAMILRGRAALARAEAGPGGAGAAAGEAAAWFKRAEEARAARFGERSLPTVAARVWRGTAMRLQGGEAAAAGKAMLRAAEPTLVALVGETDPRVAALRAALREPGPGARGPDATEHRRLQPIQGIVFARGGRMLIRTEGGRAGGAGWQAAE